MQGVGEVARALEQSDFFFRCILFEVSAGANLPRADKCGTNAMSSASSTENMHRTTSRHHLSRTKKCSTNALSASSTENNREHASGAAARNGVQESSCQNGQVQHECVVKCIINREQQRTCQRSSSTERSPSIILPERTSECSTNALSSA